MPPSHFTSAYMATWLVGNALLKDQKVPTGFLETPITVVDAKTVAAFDAASLPPAGLEPFYRRDIEALKRRDVTRLPPLTAARAPARR